MQFSNRAKMLSIVLLSSLFFSLSIVVHSQVQDMNFGDGGRKIVNHSQYDYGRGATIHNNRLLVGSSEYNSIPIISAFNNTGNQDFSFGNSGDVVTIGDILYAEDGIYAGNKLRLNGYKALIQKFTYDGQLVGSFGNGNVLETVLTSHTQFVWVDAFSGIKQWGDDIVWLGSYLDTLSIVKIHPNGSYDTSFDGDGVLKCEVSDFIEGLNTYTINSWFVIGDKLYIALDYYNTNDWEFYSKIFPINADGTVDTAGIIDVTSLETIFYHVNNETIYFEANSGLKRCIGTTFTVDNTFGVGGVLMGSGNAYSFGPDGSIYRHGSVGSSPQMGYCSRFTSDGIADASFGNNGYITVPALIAGNQVYVSDIAVDDDELYLITESGVYGVSSGGYSDIFITRYTDINSTPSNVSETLQSQQLLYPNPAKDILNFSADAANDWNIIDISGRIVHSGKTFHSGMQSIDIAMLPQGVYLLSLSQSNTQQQFIKQ